MTFAESVGIDTHDAYANTQYGNTPQVVAWLQQLGVKYVRDGTPMPQWTPNFQRYAMLKAAGIDVLGITDFRDEGGLLIPVTSAEMAQIIAEGAGAFSAFEWPNEYDKSKVPNWITVLNQYGLYAAVAGALPVIGPALANANFYYRLGDFEPKCDAGNLHVYYGSGVPDGLWLQWYITHIRNICIPTKPLWVTETGYNNALASGLTGGYTPVDEVTAAKYLLRALLFNWLMGIVRTYIYQLLDQSADPALKNPQLHYGLVRYDGSLKPAFTAVQNLLTVCGGGVATDLNVGLQTATSAELATVQAVKLFNAATGRYLIALWQRVPANANPTVVDVLVKTSLENVTFAQWHDLLTGTVNPINNPIPAAIVPVADSVVVLEMEGQ